MSINSLPRASEDSDLVITHVLGRLIDDEPHGLNKGLQFLVAAPDGLPAGFAIVRSTEESAEFRQLAPELVHGEFNLFQSRAHFLEDFDPHGRNAIGGFCLRFLFCNRLQFST